MYEFSDMSPNNAFFPTQYFKRYKIGSDYDVNCYNLVLLELILYIYIYIYIVHISH